jgi:2,4-dichlorophenol 6-monooxygenase
VKVSLLIWLKYYASTQDAHNIAFKLAAVIKGQASPKLLESYEAERRPIGVRNCDWALFTCTNHNILNTAMGVRAGGERALPQVASIRSAH